MTELPFKVLVIGDSTVGKTSFTDRYTSNKFKGEYKHTQGGAFRLCHELGSCSYGATCRPRVSGRSLPPPSRPLQWTMP